MRPAGPGAAAVETVGHGVALVNGHRDRVATVLEGVRAVLADAAPAEPRLPSPDEVHDLAGARVVLGHAWDRLLCCVTSAADGGAAASADMVTLLGEIKRVDEALTLEVMRYRDAAFGRVRDALAMLRGCDSTSALVAQAAQAACVVGFDRTIVSRIADSAWLPEKVCVERDPRWGEEILELGRANPQMLDRTVVETEMVRRKVGILVHDVQVRPAVNRVIAEASLSRSYVAVPLLADGGVVGFLHGDCYYRSRNVDGFDRQLLTVFAEGLGQALGRTAMMDRLAAIRVGFDQVAGALATVKDERVQLGSPTPRGLAEVAAGFGAGLDQLGHDDRFPVGSERSTLTRREIEVLRLMAAGDTNGRIARRLVISEGTVKSHVKHILRKLGAANRAEAVSRWLGMDHDRGGSRQNGAAQTSRREN